MLINGQHSHTCRYHAPCIISEIQHFNVKHGEQINDEIEGMFF